VTVLAIVPARGGSKGLPHKNIALLEGEPLIIHTLRAAREALSIDRIVVSTDDHEIAAIAKNAAADVIDRPPELAGDDSPTEAALLHVLETLAARGEQPPDYVVTLEPTSPLRTAALIDACVARAIAEHAGSVMTVAETHESLGRLEDGRFSFLFPDQPRRRQLREPLYRESGAVYVTRTDALLATHRVLAEPVYGVVVPDEQAVDINTPLDFVVATAILRWRKEQPSHAS
jgi:CMP-N,N'-diacetyllegionaminic acid synthase